MSKWLVIFIFVVAASVSFADAKAQVPTLSDPDTWNSDFMRSAKATPECQTDTIQNVMSRMSSVDGPYTIEEYEQTERWDRSNGVGRLNRASEFVKEMIGDVDRIYAFIRLPAERRGFGFSGYLVARGDCVIHVEIDSYIN
jgi:hypothetical protein